MDEKKSSYGPACIICIYLHIFKNGAPSWRTNRRSEIVTSVNIFPPVQKRMELQERPLKVSKYFNEISPSCELLLQSTQSFEPPGVCFHWALNKGVRMGRNVIKWVLQGSFQSLPFDCELVQNIWVDNMDVGFARMSSPNRLVNGASKDVRGNGGIWWA